mgnify:CR=1 FL=1
MIKLSDIKIGTKLELELTDSLGGKIGGSYTSQLLDIIDDHNIVIAAPIQESRLMLIPTGSTIRCSFVHHKHGLLAFMCSLTSKDKQDNIIVFRITVFSDIKKIQRRNHYRLNCTIDVLYRPLGDDDNPGINNEIPELKKACTKDISGCGACIVTDEEIEKGSYLYIVFTFNENTSIETKCLVVRCTRIEESKLTKYSLGLSFVGMSAKDQETVIKYIFERQKKLLKQKSV